MEVHGNENITITYNSGNERLTQKWSGFAPSETFREGIDKTVTFAESNRVKTLLSDALKQSVVKPEDADYAASVMPKLMGSGLKAMAFVVPESVFTKLSLQKFSNSSQGNVQYFMNIFEAESWLNKQN